MEQRPDCPSRMEVSYCTFEFGAICMQYHYHKIHCAINIMHVWYSRCAWLFERIINFRPKMSYFTSQEVGNPVQLNQLCRIKVSTHSKTWSHSSWKLIHFKAIYWWFFLQIQSLWQNEGAHISDYYAGISNMLYDLCWKW